MFWTQYMTCLLNYKTLRFLNNVMEVPCGYAYVSNRAVHIPEPPPPNHPTKTLSRTHTQSTFVFSFLRRFLHKDTHTHAHLNSTISKFLATHKHTATHNLPCTNQTALHTTHDCHGKKLNRTSECECTLNMVPPRLRCPMATFLLTDTRFRLNGKRGGTRRIHGRGVVSQDAPQHGTARWMTLLASWLLRMHCVSPSA
jgi:hypothetical protein